jgi:hypothetical protein
MYLDARVAFSAPLVQGNVVERQFDPLATAATAAPLPPPPRGRWMINQDFTSLSAVMTYFN